MRAPALGAIAAVLLAACSSNPPATGSSGTADAPAPSTPGGTAAARADATPAPELGVPHAFKVGDAVYRGPQPTAEQMQTLRARGVKTLVSLRTSKPDREAAAAAGLEVVEIPIAVGLGSEPPTDAQVKLFFETVIDPAKQPVYFHCHHGKDRTGTMAAIYRIEVDGWTNEEAIAEMKRLGFRTWYRDLEDFVRAYEPRGFRPPAGGTVDSRAPSLPRVPAR